MTTNEPKKKTAAVGLTAAEGLKPSLLTPEVDTEVVATGRTHAAKRPQNRLDGSISVRKRARKASAAVTKKSREACPLTCPPTATAKKGRLARAQTQSRKSRGVKKLAAAAHAKGCAEAVHFAPEDPQAAPEADPEMFGEGSLDPYSAELRDSMWCGAFKKPGR